MTRRTTAIAAALSLLPLGQPLLLGSTTALATGVVVLSTQAAHAQSAGDYVNAGVDEIIISAGFGQSQNEMIESMHRISEEVIPYFKKSSSQVA